MSLEPTAYECIETMAKKRYWSLVKEYNRTKEIDEALESDIELLKKFLEEADMGMLREETEKRLSNNKRTQVMIRRDTKGNLNVKVR